MDSDQHELSATGNTILPEGKTCARFWLPKFAANSQIISPGFKTTDLRMARCWFKQAPGSAASGNITCKFTLTVSLTSAAFAQFIGGPGGRPYCTNLMRAVQPTVAHVPLVTPAGNGFRITS